MRRAIGAVSVLMLAALAGCSRGGSGGDASGAVAGCTAPAGRLALAVTGAHGRHCFAVEQAQTAEAQEKGLMYRTAIAPGGGMLFWPYPPDVNGRHQPPRDANFWMKNTPSALDIIFVRANGTIARIAENAVPFDESPLPSGEPVGAVLELKGGRSAELGIAEGDRVTWAGQ